MGLRVNTNVFSLNAQKNLMNVSTKLGSSFAKLSSGLRITTAADDAAGLGISERMRSQIRSLAQAGRNTQDGISLVQTAEGAMNEISANLIRMRELAVQASSGTLSTDDRIAIDPEFDDLVSEIQRISDETEFNDIALLDGTNSTVGIQVGIDNVAAEDQVSVELTNVSSTLLAISTLDTSAVANASAALSSIDTAINSVNTARAKLGANQNQLSSAQRSIDNLRENLSAAESRIRDVDVAEETATLTKNSILQQAAVSVLAQANVQPQLALSLLG